MPAIEQVSPAMGEALRRRMGQQPSGAGIPNQSGAAPSNQGNPVQDQGLNRMPMVQSQMQGPEGGDSTAEARKIVENALPGEAQMILKSLTKVLDRLTPDPKATTL